LSKRAVALIVGVLATASIAAGCGGGGDDSSASLTKAELIKKGDEICSKGLKEARVEAVAYVKSHGRFQGDAQYAEINKAVLLPSLQQQTDEIRALGAPSGEEGEVEKILDAFDAGIEKGEENPAALFEGPNPLIKPNGLARKYGFKACGVN